MDKENIELYKTFSTELLTELFTDAVNRAQAHLAEADRHNALCSHYQNNAKVFNDILLSRERNTSGTMDQSVPVSSAPQANTPG
jgi:hypothetical protein